MHDLIELLHAIAWPITVLVIFVMLRVELQRFTKNVADRIQSANSISIGPRGFEMKGLVKAVPIPAEIQTRKVAITRFVRALTNKALLDDIADVLNIPRSTDIKSQSSDIILEINRRVDSKQSMDALSSLLARITGQRF
jgi:hypothetical protein